MRSTVYPRAMLDVVLAPGREKAVLRRHPWVMSGAVAELRGDPVPGAWARVSSSRGRVLGYGDFSPGSQIRVRMLAFGPAPEDESLVEDRLRRAIARRRGDPLLGETDAARLVNAEGDGLPGLVVDRYGDTLVVRPSTAGMTRRLSGLSEALRDETGAARAVLRPDPSAARSEGLAADTELLFGDPPEGSVPIRERDRSFHVDVLAGQKTGFYLDQRDSRDLVERLASGRRVLDLFSYTGGFGVAAVCGGAEEVTCVDSSSAALARAEEHLAANGSGSCATRFEKSDCFEFVRQSGGSSFDLLVIDPPPLARRRGDVPKASRAYKDLLIHGLRHAAPGARILFFACSHHVGPDLLGKIVFGASLDARRPLRWLRTLGAPVDHPVSVDHPEGRYLCGALLEAD